MAAYDWLDNTVGEDTGGCKFHLISELDEISS